MRESAPTAAAASGWTSYEDVQQGQMTTDVEDDQTGLQAARQLFKGEVVEPQTTHHVSANPIISTFQTNNMVQRIVSGLVLGAAVTVYLALGPAAAPIYLCSFVVSVCNYEYAWLSHRIAYRFTVTYAHQSQDDDAAMEIVPLDVTSVAVSSLPFGSRHPKLVAGAVAVIATGIVTIGFVLLQIHLFHYETVAYASIYQTPLVYTWMDFILLVAISTWVTIYCAMLTPTLSSALNSVLQQFVYSLQLITFFTCYRYDTKCYSVGFTGVARMNVVVLVLINRVPWWRRLSKTQTITAVLHVILDVVGFAYIAMLMNPVSSIIMQIDEGARIALGFLAVVWGVDTGAYFCGHLLSYVGYKRSHYLAPHISPNKDIEGSIGGILVGIAATLLVDGCWSDMTGVAVDDELLALQRRARVWRIVFAVVGGAISRYGDLFASLLKRLAGVKDTGTLIPGHGGLLDRVDAMLFLGAVFVLYHRTGFPVGYDQIISQTYQYLLNQRFNIVSAQERP
ncbi:hypothetical protein H310_05712 [Aphanomyces invadans]|uniref:Phosphatidate cytidylyltransferase n=1 Tax=Aphanomyces invadans TaxID=157072 RepID=A0A024U7C1_9STRA|nr:hypothetical protein H310_05712 [Aphanomyces invadans]ETW02120.1 hypothetical protein H310_05712 [Aphanomyces invadans]|eukprot:XP_008868725.1 hypothetical protein H310_05712 [Aphanomyces invadans]